MNVCYLCDGCVEKCQQSKGCYKNGGDCKHTTDPEHAKNFIKHGSDADINFFEKEENEAAKERVLDILDDNIRQLKSELDNLNLNRISHPSSGNLFETGQKMSSAAFIGIPRTPCPEFEAMIKKDLMKPR